VTHAAPRHLHVLALAAAALTFLVLTAGGFVTSLEAGMVFADWPLSNGSLNPEGWTKDPDKLSEHGHRLLGAALGLVTIALAIQLQRRDPRRGVRILGWAALGAVSVQGLLGGMRVMDSSTELALLHGCTGQALFCVMIALAYLTSRDAGEAPEPGPDTRGLATVALSALATIFLQVVLGAQLRHVGGPIQTHVLGAACVAGTVLWLLSTTLLRHGGRRALARPALLLAALLLVQVALGLWANGALGADGRGRGGVLLASFHQATGALLLATAVVLCLRAVRRIQPHELATAEAAR
jgi:cytochrome c oxidase assembly protein subunit 15